MCITVVRGPGFVLEYLVLGRKKKSRWYHISIQRRTAKSVYEIERFFHVAIARADICIIRLSMCRNFQCTTVLYHTPQRSRYYSKYTTRHYNGIYTHRRLRACSIVIRRNALPIGYKRAAVRMMHYSWAARAGSRKLGMPREKPDESAAVEPPEFALYG